MVIAASLTLRAPVVARPSLRPRAARRVCVVPRANVISDVGKYLSEAASQIFYPQENDTPWKGSGTPFTGSISHHEDVKRLQLLNEQIEKVKKDLESSGANPAAVAAEGDAITYRVDEKGNLVEDGSLQEYITQAVARLFGHNFKGDEDEPKEWASTGYSESWRRGGTRDVQRQYDRLVRFQKVVKKTLESAEVDAKK